MEMRNPTHHIVDAPHAMIEMNAMLTIMAPTHAKVCSVVHIDCICLFVLCFDLAVPAVRSRAGLCASCGVAGVALVKKGEGRREFASASHFVRV